MNPPKSAREVVFQAIGNASTCWNDLEGAGVFDSERAKRIGEELIADLYKIVDDEWIICRSKQTFPPTYDEKYGYNRAFIELRQKLREVFEI